MTDTNITDAVVFPEDDGTGVADGSEDYDSAGHFGLLSQHQGGTYVGNGLGFNNIDTTNETVDIGAGHAFVEVTSVTVQSGSGATYDTTLPDPMVMTIVLPTSVTLQLDADSVNDVYLATDPTNNDGAYLRHGSSVSEPTDPFVDLGTVNTSDGSTTRQNDNASPTYDTVTSNSVDTDGESITSSTVRAYTDPANGTYQDYQVSDFADIGAAINQAVSDGAQAAQLPPGTFAYSTDMQLPNGFILRGQGMEPGNNPTLLDYTGSGSGIDCATNTTSLVMRDVWLRGPDASGSTIGIDGPERLRMLNCSVARFGTNIDITSFPNYVSIANCDIVNGGDGIVGRANVLAITNGCRISQHSGNGFRATDSCTVLMVRDSTFENCGDIPFDYAVAGGYRIAVEDCYFEGNDGAIDVLIRGTTAENVQGPSVEGNYFNMNGTADTAVRVDSCDGATLRDNVVIGSATLSYNIQGGAVETVTENEHLLDIQLSDSGTRTLREGVGENAGALPGNGQWDGNGREGIKVVDTTNGVVYHYRGGAWV